VPCSISYPRLLAHGLARPSYEMACRIEQITGGQVSRTQWYPAPDPGMVFIPDLSVEDMLR